MGKVNRLRNRMNLLLPCFGSRQCTCVLLTLPAGPASLHRRTQSKSLWPVRWWRVGSIPSEDALATSLYLSSMLFINGADAGIGLLNGFTVHPENTNVKF